MKQWFLLPALLLTCLELEAQDAYHRSLNNTLQNVFSLPANAAWVLPNTLQPVENLTASKFLPRKTKLSLPLKPHLTDICVFKNQRL
jgi:hypothetical protein